ncbi:head-tail connector protein [Aurantimonas sp. A2-1-M11]|uniref:head-tail connector protein n=1 Tax=Aurantimonas sp. A2-1-M11 TaxID=3113712 RepID=UPI002F94F97F
MTIIDLGLGDAGEPASVAEAEAEAKAWARIDRDDEDGLIGGLIRAARETIEALTGLVLVQRAFRLALDPVPADGRWRSRAGRWARSPW